MNTLRILNGRISLGLSSMPLLVLNGLSNFQFFLTTMLFAWLYEHYQNFIILH